MNALRNHSRKTSLPPSATSRRGWTLIEHSVNITLLAVLSIMALQMLGLMLRFDSSTSGYLVDSIGRQHLADRFRLDVHQAVDFQLTPNPGTPETNDKLTLTQPDGSTVIYECEPGRVTRLIPGKQSLRPRERNMFPVGEQIPHFEQQSGRLRLLLDGPYPLSIDAVPGRRRP